MTDKEIILKTLNFLKTISGHAPTKEFWDDLDDNTKIRIKLKLEENKLVSPHIYDTWSLMITSAGLKVVLNSEHLDDNGNLKESINNLQYRILVYLNERPEDYNITDASIKTYLKCTDYDYEQAMSALRNMNYVGTKEGKLTLTATNQGKIKLNELSQEIIGEQKDEIAELTKLNLKLQNTYLPHATNQLKQRTTTFIIGGIIGIVAGMIPVIIDRCFPNKEEPIQLKIFNYPTKENTNGKIYNREDTISLNKEMKSGDTLIENKKP